MIRHGWSRVAVACAAAMMAVVVAAARPAVAQRQISADVYLDKARGMWLGELIGNYAGRSYVPGTKISREGYIVRGGANFDIGWGNVLATNPWVAGVSNEGFSVHAAQFYAAMYADAATESNVVTIIGRRLSGKYCLGIWSVVRVCLRVRQEKEHDSHVVRCSHPCDNRAGPGLPGAINCHRQPERVC